MTEQPNIRRGSYGRIDLDDLPPQELIQRWIREARGVVRYDSPIEAWRQKSDYVWSRIADWQEEKRGGQ